MNFHSTLIFRPTLLNKKQNNNWIENIGSYFLKTITVESLARTMFHLSTMQIEKKTSGLHIIVIE